MDSRGVIRVESSLAEDGNIFLKLQMKASGETVDLNPCIKTNRK
jgi:hypothetical protein